MLIESLKLDTSIVPPHQKISVISTYNKNLLKIQSQIENRPEIDVDTRREINKTLRNTISELYETYNKKLNSKTSHNTAIKKKLQLLRIKYSLTAIKCGDTDWEIFQISEFLYRNVDNFINSHHCVLTLDEQKTQRIDSTLRNTVWLSCLYNFSRELVYGRIAAPQNRENKLFYDVFSHLKKRAVPDNLACAISNAQAALRLCELSFGEEPAQQDVLYCDLKEIVEFYDDYLQARYAGEEVDFLMQNAYFKRAKTLIPDDAKHEIALGYYEQITEYL
ncbi:hypothetical protein [Candidatus Symbiopectobacterium sp. NZEC135]|uniref:hypothetical protein n=1 Tax=Candidatus Symbiopectobacterium sp. NZEC135 TaxID=2820471 RepID=UPI00222696FA|nr:hypothetical protein [Candidatus Symbiopectobacterium sp. NZEC135]MCW2480828.1 hypothetical protein [Candidatus Symbiopectobacterium sp. NZEC135]